MNYEKMWFNLKKYINTKNSHGKNELKTEMENMEINENQSPTMPKYKGEQLNG